MIDILTEPTPRQKLDHINTIDDVVNLLKRSRNIIVLTGAGVSNFVKTQLRIINGGGGGGRRGGGREGKRKKEEKRKKGKNVEGII